MDADADADGDAMVDGDGDGVEPSSSVQFTSQCTARQPQARTMLDSNKKEAGHWLHFTMLSSTRSYAWMT